MNRIKKLMKNIVVDLAKIAYLTYDQFALLFKGNLFCLIVNLRAILLGWPMRYSFDSKSGQYAGQSDGLRKVFYARSQALNTYRKSLKARAAQLEATYILSSIKFKDGDTVIDCGANVSDFKLVFDVKGVAVNYIGIEPSPAEHTCAEINARPGLVKNIGLWNKEDSLKFYVSSSGADSSFIEPPYYEELRYIPTQRLDSMKELADLPHIKLFKLEAEGAEPEALEGAAGLLDKIEYISADLGFERGITQESTLAPVVNFMLRNGFEVVEMRHDRIVVLFRNKNFQKP